MSLVQSFCRGDLERIRIASSKLLLVSSYCSSCGSISRNWHLMVTKAHYRSVPSLAVLGVLKCRYSELVSSPISEIFVSDSVAFYQSKVSRRRVVDCRDFHFACQSNNVFYDPELFNISYDQLRRDTLAALNLMGFIGKGNHNFVTHLPRRMYVTEEVSKGLSFDEIALRIGHRNPETSKKYFGGYGFLNK